MKQAIGLGAGGHARIIVEILRLLGEFEIVGLLDANPEALATRVSGIAVLGNDLLMPEIYARGVRHAFVGVGGIGDNRSRARLYHAAQGYGFEMIGAIDPRSIVSPSAIIGSGTIIMPAAVINAGARTGENVIINTGAIVEHDCSIGDHVHIATGACLAGTVTVLPGAHIGVGAAIKQGVQVGRNALVGAGAVVINDVPDDTTVVGVPARPLGS
jgi:UDP-perosamine 4-acetyltransferase